MITKKDGFELMENTNFVACIWFRF